MDSHSTDGVAGQDMTEQFACISARAKQIAGQDGFGMLDTILTEAQDKEDIQKSLNDFASKCEHPLGDESAQGNKMAAGLAWVALEDAQKLAKIKDATPVVNAIENELRQPFIEAFTTQYGDHPREHNPNSY